MIAYPYDVDGVVLRVLEEGDGPETVVLLHGLGARADRWRATMPALAAASRRVFALDFPGHGFSEKNARVSHGVPAYARLVRSFVEQIGGAGTTTLVGTSLGGHVAATAALAAPDAFRGVVLVGPVGLQPLGPGSRAAIAASIVDTSPEGIRRKLAQVLHDPGSVTPEWIREEHLVNSSPGAEEALGAIARYFAETVDEHVLGDDGLRTLAAATPTLFIWGESDTIVPLEVADHVERLLGVDVVRIPQAGHLPYLENPAVFNGAVLEFMRSYESRSHAAEGAQVSG